ncbi:MAG: SPFH/Band 7/PHB domain protein [Clostridia bacterium]|nr:SPFH/Band 7/PHB domain protein [Clostridia bacterium]
MEAAISTTTFILIALIILVIIMRNVRIVAQAHCYIVERLGQYKATWNAGLHIKIPFIDRVVKEISLKEQVFDFPPQSVITKDNVSMSIDSVVYAKVFEPKLYNFGVEDPMLGLQHIASTTLRSIIGGMELDETLSSRDKINMQMQSILDNATDPWGIKVSRVEIKNITPPSEIEEVMTKQMRAERERRQKVLEAQAHQEAVVSRATGDKQAKIMAAEAERDAQIALADGRAEAIKRIYEAEALGIKKLAEAGINEGVLRLKSIEALKNVADGQATKIYLPNDLHQSLASIELLGDAISPKKAASKPKKANTAPPVKEQEPQNEE